MSKAWTPRRMKRLRKKYDLSQAGLAQIVGVTSQAVSMWETGVRPPSRSTQIMFCMLEDGVFPYPIPPRRSGRSASPGADL